MTGRAREHAVLAEARVEEEPAAERGGAPVGVVGVRRIVGQRTEAADPEGAEHAQLRRRPWRVGRVRADRGQHHRGSEYRDRGETPRRRRGHGNSSAKLTESMPAFALMRNATTHAPGMWNLSPSTR